MSFPSLFVHVLWLSIAALLAGIVNSIAGGGTFIAFPALLGMGLPPVEANATNTVALWPGQLAAIATLRQDVSREMLPVTLLTSSIGGVLGAEVLLHTHQSTFLHLVPWLLLFGSLLFSLSGPLSRWQQRKKESTQSSGQPILRGQNLFWVLLPVSFYIGYFGAGAGLLVMTVFALAGYQDIRLMNAMKLIVGSTSNLCAIVTFMVSGRILWKYCLYAMLFAAAGGYIGASLGRRLNAKTVRYVVVVIGFTLAGYYYWREY